MDKIHVHGDRSLTSSCGGTAMSLKGPTKEDLVKIHEEINQINNQRFIITTLSITVFGVTLAWIVPQTKPPVTDIGPFEFLVAIILSILLFGMYLWSHFLRGFLRIYTTYLIV